MGFGTMRGHNLVVYLVLLFVIMMSLFSLFIEMRKQSNTINIFANIKNVKINLAVVE